MQVETVKNFIFFSSNAQRTRSKDCCERSQKGKGKWQRSKIIKFIKNIFTEGAWPGRGVNETQQERAKRSLYNGAYNLLIKWLNSSRKCCWLWAIRWARETSKLFPCVHMRTHDIRTCVAGNVVATGDVASSFMQKCKMTNISVN